MRCCLIILSVFCLTSIAAAQEKPAEKVTYKDHVQPILRARCGSCHNANDRKGSLVVDDYATLMEGGSSGSVLEAGDPSASYLWELITHSSEPKMPPNGKVPDAELAVIQKWIEGGLLENSGSVANVKAKPSLAKVEIKPGQRPAQIAMPAGWLGDPQVQAVQANGVTALATSPWAPLVAVSGHRQIALYNSQTLAPLGVLPYPEGQPYVLRFSPAGDLLLVGGGRGGSSGNVVVFDVRTGERKIETGAEYDAVLAADISADQTLVALGGPKRLVRVFSTATGEQVHEIKKHTDWVTALAFSPDGVLLATGDRSNGLVVWESESGLIFYDLSGHKGAITEVAWRADGNVLASASEDGTIKLWDMNNGKEIKSWNAHPGGVASLKYLADGRIASVGRDKVARLWQGDGTKIRDFAGLADIGMEIAFDGESKRILAGDWTGMIPLWNSEDGTAVGKIDTNPPTLQSQIDEIAKALAAAEAEAQAKAAQQAALEKQAADRKAAAATAAAALMAATTKSQQSTAAVQQAQDAAKKQQTATEAAAAALAQADKLAAEKQQSLMQAATALQQAEAALAQAKANFEKATKDQTAAQAVLAEAQKAKQAATDSSNTAKTQLTAVQTALQQAQAAEKTAVDAATAAKAAADKAQAEANLTPEQQKALQETQQAAQAAKQRIEQLKAQLEKLKAQQAPKPAQAAQAG